MNLRNRKFKSAVKLSPGECHIITNYYYYILISLIFKTFT